MVEVEPISQQIWDMKYRLKGADGGPVDKTIPDTWRRIARALAAPEKDAELWQGRFFEALEDFRFLPAGRIASGAGSERAVTLFNCFVMGAVPDDMGGIFDGLKEAAMDLLDHIGPRKGEQVVVALQVVAVVAKALAAKILLAEVIGLHHRPHRSVIDEDAFLKDFTQQCFGIAFRHGGSLTDKSGGVIPPFFHDRIRTGGYRQVPPLSAGLQRLHAERRRNQR